MKITTKILLASFVLTFVFQALYTKVGVFGWAYPFGLFAWVSFYTFVITLIFVGVELYKTLRRD